jgi:hypothetical protein
MQSKRHLRSVLIAYAVAAAALLVIFVLTQELVVLTVLAVVALACAVQVFFLSRGGSANSMVDTYARAESDARKGNIPPERRGNF